MNQPELRGCCVIQGLLCRKRTLSFPLSVFSTRFDRLVWSMRTMEAAGCVRVGGGKGAEAEAEAMAGA